ncbi:MAG: transposase, partial [candidate division WOR-3 bacterium]
MSIFLKISKKSRVKRNRREQKRRRRLLQKNRLWLKSILDEIARNGAKESIEEALKLERDEFLARKRHERVPKEKFRGYRNGYSRRSVNLGCGHIEIKMPRVSDSSEPFASQILPPYMRTSPKLLETFPELYLYGLSSGDFREALKILLGEKA